ncbi:MAG: hypothetical protein ABI658_23385 [Acidimicrobiales bacterium]
MAKLDDLLAQHRAEPFPASVVKGLDYGEVDAVMIDADIYGWASNASSSGGLSPTERVALQAARDRLARSLGEFPHDARAYYEMLLQLANLALGS